MTITYSIIDSEVHASSENRDIHSIENYEEDEREAFTKLCSTKQPRQTQNERSKAMRKRIISATIECLHVSGFAGTTINSIARAANTSNGSPLHHFSTKTAIIEATAEHLIEICFKSAMQICKEIAEQKLDLKVAFRKLWVEYYMSSYNSAMLEILIASKRDKQLASVIKPSIKEKFKQLKQAWEAEIEGFDKSTEVYDAIGAMLWVCQGLSISSHLFKSADTPVTIIESAAELLVDHVQMGKPLDGAAVCSSLYREIDLESENESEPVTT